MAYNPWGTFGTSTINVVGGGTTTPTTTTTTTSAGTTSQDRINIGFGPRLGQAPSSTGGFQWTGQTAITPDDYLSRRVDFTKEFIGLPSLAKTTGIATTTTAVGEDVELGKKKESDDDTQSILGMGTAISGETDFDAMKVGLENMNTTDYSKYSDYLTASGKTDRVGMVRSIYEPLFGGDISDVNLGEFVTTAQEAPAKAGKAASEYLKDPSKIAKKGMASVVAAVMPFPAGPAIGGIIGGETVQNAFGNASLRPSGMFGVVHDAVLSRQYQDMALIKSTTAADLEAMQTMGASYVPSDTGFALQFRGGFGVTRKPGGSGYIGNTMGLSHQQLKNMEAVSKGYLPQSYTFDPSQKKNFFGQNTNVRIEDSGGAMSGGASFYNANGTFYDGRTGQTSAVGMRSDMQKLADSYGLDYKQAEKAVMDARSGRGTVMDNIRSIQADQQRAERAAAEKARQEAAAAKAAQEQREKLRQAEVQRARFAASQGGGGDDSYQSSYESAKAAGASDYGASYAAGVESYGISGLAAGGTVGMAAGGAMAAGSSGFIGAPPSQVPEEKTVADDQKTQYPEGTFIINAAAVEEAGEADIIKMLNDAEKEAVRRGITVDKSENSAKLIDVAVSQGEVKVAPYLAKVIGYDRLRKINNRGKPEVAERQQEAAQGGFLGYADGGELISSELRAAYASGKTEGQTENYEDRIILDEVNRRMQEAIEDAEARGVDVSHDYFPVYDKRGNRIKGGMYEKVKRLASETDIEFIPGDFYSDSEDRVVNVPRTPSLLNYFILAEELHHLEKPQHIKTLYDQNLAEGSYAEELRAKEAAYETVKGMLPKGKRTVQMTKDNYAETFMYYLNQAPEVIRDKLITSMKKKYPELNRVATKQEEEQVFRARAMGGFIGYANGGTIASPSRRPKMEQLGDVEMRAELDLFLQNDALARLGYMLYENRDIRLNAMIANPPVYDKEGNLVGGTMHSFGGSFHPAEGVRQDKQKPFTPPQSSPTMSKIGTRTKAQGVKEPIEDRVPHAFYISGESINQNRDEQYITIAHELRHAALDYLSKKYDFELEPLAFEEKMMAYADIMAREKAVKSKPSTSKRPKEPEQHSRMRRDADSDRVKRIYDLYNGLAEDALKNAGYPAQTFAKPAQIPVKPKGFLDRAMSLFN